MNLSAETRTRGVKRQQAGGRKENLVLQREGMKSRLFDSWTDSIMCCKREHCASADSLNHQTQLIIVVEPQKAANSGRLGCIVSGRLANVCVRWCVFVKENSA